MRVDDALRAVDAGVTAISVSNHGGNNLDGTPASIRALPAVAEAVGDQIEVLLDGGIRRGSDVVKAVALGARAVMIGRAYLWGLAANGQAGVENVLDILRGGHRLRAARARPLVGRTSSPARTSSSRPASSGASASRAPTPRSGPADRGQAIANSAAEPVRSTSRRTTRVGFRSTSGRCSGPACR